MTPADVEQLLLRQPHRSPSLAECLDALTNTGAGELYGPHELVPMDAAAARALYEIRFRTGMTPARSHGAEGALAALARLPAAERIGRIHFFCMRTGRFFLLLLAPGGRRLLGCVRIQHDIADHAAYLLLILSRRFRLPAGARERILSCKSFVTMSRWCARCETAASLAGVFDEGRE
jgi:hypothetical protein